MPGLNGFGVIKKLMDRKGKLPQIIFATAFDNYAVQAFEVNAIDYVLKPFERAASPAPFSAPRKRWKRKPRPASAWRR